MKVTRESVTHFTTLWEFFAEVSCILHCIWCTSHWIWHFVWLVFRKCYMYGVWTYRENMTVVSLWAWLWKEWLKVKVFFLIIIITIRFSFSNEGTVCTYRQRKKLYFQVRFVHLYCLEVREQRKSASHQSACTPKFLSNWPVCCLVFSSCVFDRFYWSSKTRDKSHCHNYLTSTLSLLVLVLLMLHVKVYWDYMW